jgi:hypothetical protein
MLSVKHFSVIFFLSICVYSTAFTKQSFKEQTLKKTYNLTGFIATEGLLFAASYGMFLQGTKLYTNLISPYSDKINFLKKIMPLTPQLLSGATILPLLYITHYYLAKPLQQSIYMLLSGNKLSPEELRICIVNTIEYALYVQIINTLKLELTDLINNVNVNNYQTFNNRPQILDAIFAQLTQNSLSSDFNKICDMQNAFIIDITRELFIVIDQNKIVLQEISQLQELIMHIKKQEKETYEVISAHVRKSENLGLYHILHDVYAQIKIVSAGLQHGIDVKNSASLLHETLNDFLDHWMHVMSPLQEKLEKQLAYTYQLQAIEKIIENVRNLRVEK